MGRLLLVVFAVAFVCFGISSLLRHRDPFAFRMFDKEVWGANAKSMDADNPRASMCRDLLTNHVQVGMSRQTIEQMLGQPDGGETNDTSTYILGMWSGMRMDCDVLEIEFDTQGKAGRLSVMQH
ncbi:hypothetical protein [Lacipirellula limnantheis]|uniref:SmpA / OmlA family protein n=1 Tax=Lacipirellula limnantheis TaxID=2528024 RepID=A0A517U1T1_9BACT|nr:hypothetical protein [Lacipirellula limnantheis]QDT74577.1 hypothetical protein I41_37740 [Lacipirellula limnantheis]